MKIFKYIFNHQDHNVYYVTDRIIIIKRKNKISFYVPKYKAPKLSFAERLHNFKCYIKPNKKWKYFYWLIRLPILYLQKTNSEYCIGFPNLYLWIIR